jgi:hypothetical protein
MSNRVSFREIFSFFTSAGNLRKGLSMKRAIFVLGIVALLGLMCQSGLAVVVSYDFETGWSGDYAPGWVNSAYRHGEAPVGKMMQQTTTAHSGSYGMQLTADSTPQDWMWWASVSVESVPLAGMMDKQYNPWISAWYYDPGWEAGDMHAAGQIMSVPSWVNPYISGSEDWTDIQFGARMNQATPNDQYYYVAAGEGSPGWKTTGVDRKNGDWVNLKMQLLSDGKVHFYVDGTEVGASYRNDYTDLGLDIGLYTMFTDPLSGWEGKPSTIWDDFQYGSDATPEPATIVIWSLFGGLGLVFAWRKRKSS